MPAACAIAVFLDPNSSISLCKAGWPIAPSRAKDSANLWLSRNFGGPFGFDTD
jgi:hypothetical protein